MRIRMFVVRTASLGDNDVRFQLFEGPVAGGWFNTGLDALKWIGELCEHLARPSDRWEAHFHNLDGSRGDVYIGKAGEFHWEGCKHYKNAKKAAARRAAGHAEEAQDACD